MANAHARIGQVNYRTEITAGGHALLADEGPALGGADAGPAPYDLLLASLGACSLITLRMYAERKGWPLQGVDLDLHYGNEGDVARIERVLSFHGPLDAAQRARLMEIVERTPVTLTLKGGVPIVSRMA
jgi:putative redox protein